MLAQPKIRIFARTNEIFLAFCVTCVLLLITAWILHFFPVSTLADQDIKQLFLPFQAELVVPKPQERFIFTILLLLLPGLILAAIYVVRRHFNKLKQIPWLIPAIMLPCLTAIILFCAPVFFNLLAIKAQQIKCSLLTYTLITIGLYFFLTLSTRITLFKNQRRYSTIAVIVVLLGIFIYHTIAFKISNVLSVNQNDLTAWTYHFEPVLFPLVEVMAGKTLLVNLSSMYGLYAELLKPIFYFTGVSIFSTTLVFALLQLISLFCLTFFLLKVIKSRLVIFMCMSCIGMLSVWTSINFAGWEPYYQYWPIRFLFPAVSLFLFFKIVQKPLFKNFMVLTFWSALGIIWNLDSGIPMLITLLGYVITFLIIPQKGISRRYACQLLLAIAGFSLLLLTLFAFYLQRKSGATLHWQEIFKYQQISYIFGYMMSPLPRDFDPWQIVCAIYVFGLCGFLYSWIVKRRSVFWDLNYYLSILGFGLFAYFSGRAFVSNLIMVSWPAILMAFMLLDRLLRMIRLALLPDSFAIVCVPLLAFGLSVSVDFLLSVLDTHFAASRIHTMLQSQPTYFSENLKFIREHSRGHKSAIILSPNQAAYLAELKLASGIDSTGVTQLFLKKDFTHYLQLIAANKTDDIFLDTNLSGDARVEYRYALDHYKAILTQYRFVASNENGMMLYSRQ